MELNYGMNSGEIKNAERLASLILSYVHAISLSRVVIEIYCMFMYFFHAPLGNQF